MRFPATPGWGQLAAAVCGVWCVVCGVWCAAVVCWWGCGWCVVWLVPRHSWRRFLCATPRHSWLGFAAGGGGRSSPLLAEGPGCGSPPLLAGVRRQWWCAAPRHSWLGPAGCGGVLRGWGCPLLCVFVVCVGVRDGRAVLCVACLWCLRCWWCGVLVRWVCLPRVLVCMVACVWCAGGLQLGVPPLATPGRGPWAWFPATPGWGPLVVVVGALGALLLGLGVCVCAVWPFVLVWVAWGGVVHGVAAVRVPVCACGVWLVGCVIPWLVLVVGRHGRVQKAEEKVL